MNTPNPSGPDAPARFTEHGIPIRNLWHMLLYAWNEAPLEGDWLGHDLDDAPTLDFLLASMLVKLMRQRLRIGLGREYVQQAGLLRAIRGRVDFAESLRRHTFERGEAYCEPQEYSLNEPRNQIIRSTLVNLARTGRFGPEPGPAKALRHSLSRLARDLDGIDLIEVRPDLIQKQLLLRNDRDYRLMLAICELILRRAMPLESDGTKTFPALDRDALVLHDVYERFVAAFYRVHLNGWEVAAQKRLEWPVRQASKHLPQMVPDLVLREKSSGRMIVLDTKFTPESLVENRWGKPVFDSSHLYQLYAYLRSQEQRSRAHRTATGILLYPAVHHQLSERIELPDHIMQIECLDLAAPWQEIERHLLRLVGSL